MTLQLNNPRFGNVTVDADTFDELRSLKTKQISHGFSAIVKGALGIADGLGGIFVWDSTSVDQDDDQTVIAPSDGGPGRWVKIAVGQIGSRGNDGAASTVPGPTGPADNTYTAVDALKASDTARVCARLSNAADVPDGEFKFVSGGVALADDRDIIASNNGAGAWVRISETPRAEMLIRTSPTGIGGGRGMWVYLLDSLTDGAFGTNYREYLDKLLRAQFGDGGPGYHGFGAGVAADVKAGFNKSDDLQYIEILTPTFGSLSVDGRGLFSLNASDASFLWAPATKWTNARVFFEGGADFGSIKWKFDNEPESSARTIDCSDKTGLSWIDINYTGPDARAITFFAGTGKLAFYGADFILDRNGYRPGNFAQGGRFLRDVAAQNSPRRRQWFTLLKPVRVMLDGGMNDRLTRTPEQHYADMTAVVTDIQAATPDCAILMIQSLEPADYATSNFRAYTSQKIRVATERGLAFTDLRKTLGAFPTANAAGLMFSDGVHPSDKGNRLKAQAYAAAAGIPIGGDDPGLTKWVEVGGDTPAPAPRGNLANVDQIEVKSGARKALYSIGLTNGYSTCVVTLHIAAQRIGTSAVRVVETAVALTSQFTVNEAYLADGQPATLSSRTILVTKANDGQTVDLTVDAVSSNNRITIGVTPSFDAKMNVTATYEMLDFYPVGQTIYENMV